MFYSKAVEDPEESALDVDADRWVRTGSTPSPHHGTHKPRPTRHHGTRKPRPTRPRGTRKPRPTRHHKTTPKA